MTVVSLTHGSQTCPEIAFQAATSLSVGQLVCIIQDYGPTANGTPRVGPALAVGRMALPSDLVEGGTKGKALTLLHAWKDQLWEMGGGERPPRPRLLHGSLNKEEDTDEERIDGEVEAVAETQPTAFGNEDTPKELTGEGACSGRGGWKLLLKCCRGLQGLTLCPSRIYCHYPVTTAAWLVPDHSIDFQ